MNVDPRNPTARPDPTVLVGQGFLRFPYNISDGQGVFGLSQIEAAHRLYAPYVDRILMAGKRPIIILTHQTYGEGRAWASMSEADWRTFIPEWTEFVTRYVVGRYRGMRVVWQIWNEQDAASVAAVGIAPHLYRLMLEGAYRAIKAADPSSTVITGGFVGGPGVGLRYASAMGDGWTADCDGIGLHEYGSDTPEAPHPTNSTGHIKSKLATWKLATRKPLWITEWGVLGEERALIPLHPQIVRYARAFIRAVAGEAQCACWFAWGKQHDGYPVASDNGVRQDLLDALRLTVSSIPVRPPALPNEYRLHQPNALNLRDEASLSGRVLRVVRAGEGLMLFEDTVEADGYRWRRVRVGEVDGWIAAEGGAFRTSVLL